MKLVQIPLTQRAYGGECAMDLLSLYHSVDHENRKRILDLIEVDANARIIDLGCADGEFALKLAEKAGTKEIFGADFLKASCLKAKARGIKVHCAEVNYRVLKGAASHVIAKTCITDM
jgi:tRNA G46 methylase TrmB